MNKVLTKICQLVPFFFLFFVFIIYVQSMFLVNKFFPRLPGCFQISTHSLSSSTQIRMLCKKDFTRQLFLGLIH